MFGFLTPAAKETTDPLASVKGVTAWLRELPAQDVVGRQQNVMRAFDEMRQSRRPVDPGRAQALLGEAGWAPGADGIVPYQAFRTADDWLVLAVGNDGQWQRFCRAAGRDDLAGDGRFRDVTGFLES